jgi:hypothetical protein
LRQLVVPSIVARYCGKAISFFGRFAQHTIETNIARMVARIASVFLQFVVAAAVVALLAALPRAVRYIDVHVLHEVLRDAWGRLAWQESWATATPLPSSLDYSWLDRAPRPIRIAHALGAAGVSEQNTLVALESAISIGAQIVEVDLWLDVDGRLRCHHGPESPVPFTPGDCEFSVLLDRLSHTQAFVMLDIKTDFARAGAQAVAIAASRAVSERVVFQLYRPEDVAQFGAWATRERLAGPVITAYLSHRGLPYLAAQAKRLRIGALAVPYQRLPALDASSAGVPVLVHPVHDCAAWRSAVLAGATGLYVTLPLLGPDTGACKG